MWSKKNFGTSSFYGGCCFIFVLLVLIPVDAKFFELFDHQQKEEKKTTTNPVRYKDVYPVYWKEPDCQPAKDTGRYLLMSKRNGGWNNERMILENAIIMAWITNRTLVIPNQLRYDHMHGQETFEKFVDLTYARCFAPIITSDNLPKLTNGEINEKFEGAETYHDAFTFYIEYNNQLFAVPHVPLKKGDLRSEFDLFRSGRMIVNQLPPSDGISVGGLKVNTLNNTAKFLNSKKHFFCLYYIFYWFEDKNMHNQMIEIIKNGVHYRERFWDDAFPVLAELGAPGTFSTIHIRARDFRREGGYYSHFKSKSWIDSMSQNHRNTFLPGETVYISTDEKSLSDIKDLQDQLKEYLGVESRTIYDYLDKFKMDSTVRDRRWEFWGTKKIDQKEAEEFNLNDFGPVEQIICAHGRRFIGTFFSTYTAHIIRLRGYLPFETIKTDEHLFWDRTLPSSRCSHQSSPESCDPSWSGHFRGSLWASEYEEGWLTYEQVRAKKAARKNRESDKDKKSDSPLDWLSLRIQNRLEQRTQKEKGPKEKEQLTFQEMKDKHQETKLKLENMQEQHKKARDNFLQQLRDKVKNDKK